MLAKPRAAHSELAGRQVAGAGAAAAGLLLVLVAGQCHLGDAGSAAANKQIKCQAEECNMREAHFKLYSMVKRARDENFNMKGKDIIPLVRAAEVLRRRFLAAPTSPAGQQLNGTKLVLALLEDEKLRKALEVFQSDAGRELINVFKSSINGNHQNLACSKWRVDELELVARRLASDAKLAEVFANIHKSFLERSARKCLKSACSSLDENMNRLESIQPRQGASRRRGFLAREDTTGKLYEENALVNALDEPLGPAGEQNGEGAEFVGEFQREERELCHFFKRTNETRCQASGNELSEISFLKPVRVNNETVQANLGDFLRDFGRNKKLAPVGAPGLDGADGASSLVLAQCRSLQPLLAYHMHGLRWYQRHDLIAGQKLRVRAFWCPSLSYWLEVDRLCNELESKLAPANGGGGGGEQRDKGAHKGDNQHDTFAY